MKNQYVAPSLTVLGSLSDLTLTKEKVENLTPDGFSFKGIILTS
jgi:hypothetical protein